MAKNTGESQGTLPRFLVIHGGSRPNGACLPSPEKEHGTRKLVVWVDVSPFPFGDIFIFWGGHMNFAFSTPTFSYHPKNLSSFGAKWQHTQHTDMGDIQGSLHQVRRVDTADETWQSMMVKWPPNFKKVTTHTDIAHPTPIPPVLPSMKGIPAYSPFNAKVAQGCVPVRCVETTFRPNRVMQEREQFFKWKDLPKFFTASWETSENLLFSKRNTLP